MVTTRIMLIEGPNVPGEGVGWEDVPTTPAGSRMPYGRAHSAKHTAHDDSADLRASMDTTASKVDALFVMLQDSLRAQHGPSYGAQQAQPEKISKTKKVKKNTKSKLRAAASGEADVDAGSATSSSNSNITIIGM